MRSLAFRIATCCCVMGLAFGCASGGGAGASSASSGRSPYDVLDRSYGPYVDRNDPLAFPMKVRSLAEDKYTFWRGGRDLFYRWCGTQCHDWLADRTSYVTSHGDLHLGNMGTYPSADGPLGALAFGEVDFDESARLPYQIELLQGLVTLRLVAEENTIRLSKTQRGELTSLVIESYRAARNGETSLDDVSPPDPDVEKLFAKASRKPYSESIEKYTNPDGGGFRAVVTNEDGEPKDVLRPVTGHDDAFATALGQAVANSPALKARLRFADAAGARPLIRAVVLRTRLGSSGSQGLRKYLILLESPLRDYEGDAILYLKEQVPTAAERAGIIPRDPRPPGRRCAEDTADLTQPDPLLNSWCDLEGSSYALLFREPWSDELSPKKVKSYDELLTTARLWGTVAGSAHRLASGGAKPFAKAPSALSSDLSRRADDCLRQLGTDFTRFRADPRVASMLRIADSQISQLPKDGAR